MNNDQLGGELARLIEDIVEQRLKSFRHFADYGVVTAVANGLADVKINGSNDVTKGVPYRSDMTLAVGNKVTILNLNFNRNDRLIIDKRS